MYAYVYYFCGYFCCMRAWNLYLFFYLCVCVFSSMFIGLKGDIYFVHWRYFCGGWDFNVVKTGGLRLVF